MEIIFKVVITILGAIAALLGIYRGWIAWKKWKIECSITKFKNTRTAVKKNRPDFRRIAMKLDQESSAYLKIINDIPLLANETWFPPKPIPLESVELMIEQDPQVKIDLSTQSLPRYAGGKYKKYSQAIEELDKPKKFQDRDQYRLLRVDRTRLVFSDCIYSYFDKINYGEYLVYEQAYHSHEKMRSQRCSNRNRFLQQIREPADYIILCGVSTLTMLHDGTDLRIIMHKRGYEGTAMSSGTLHVIPAGEFQPSCQAPASVNEDFDLWKNIMREYAEELCGMEEYDGNSAVPFNYDDEPFVSFVKERANNNIRPFYLGIGLDPVSLEGEILTVVVFKEETFNKIFRDILTINDEGEIVTDSNRWGRQFTKMEYDSCRRSNILPAAEAILNITWNHREFFKECFK